MNNKCQSGGLALLGIVAFVGIIVLMFSNVFLGVIGIVALSVMIARVPSKPILLIALLLFVGIGFYGLYTFVYSNFYFESTYNVESNFCKENKPDYLPTEFLQSNTHYNINDDFSVDCIYPSEDGGETIIEHTTQEVYGDSFIVTQGD